MLVAAQSLPPAALAALFNQGYSGYPVPLRFGEAALSRHIAYHDIDLACSRVAMRDGPVAFALVARRGPEGWVGGMGAIPSRRRQRHGERALTAALDAAAQAGVRTVRLEVLEVNQAATALYLKLGFTVTRKLMIWALTPSQQTAPQQRAFTVSAAQAWIAAHRLSREPWQRADATLHRMRADGVGLAAVVIERAGEIVAAAICTEEAADVRVLQLGAVDEAATTDLLLAASAGPKPLRLVNFAADEVTDSALLGLGARVTMAQYEMTSERLAFDLTLVVPAQGQTPEAQ